ncbi:MAG: hypothetical protein GY810_23720 [Aureispira sp.]|nr:hypothetical protein [Aureispira sp.]
MEVLAMIVIGFIALTGVLLAWTSDKTVENQMTMIGQDLGLATKDSELLLEQQKDDEIFNKTLEGKVGKRELKIRTKKIKIDTAEYYWEYSASWSCNNKHNIGLELYPRPFVQVFSVGNLHYLRDVLLEDAIFDNKFVLKRTNANFP